MADSDMAITLCIVGYYIKNSIDLHRNNNLKTLTIYKYWLDMLATLIILSPDGLNIALG